MTDSILVWDREETPPPGFGQTLLWRSYAETSGVSVPRHLENNADRIRARYLAFIHELGETRIAGKSVIEHLSLSDGFSFWWMTLLAEKSPLKSSSVYTCLRLLALEEMLLDRKPRELTLDSSDRELTRAIAALCRRLQIRFTSNNQRRPEGERPARDDYPGVPPPVRGLVSFFRHLFLRRPLRLLQKPSWFSGDDAVFFCSYFAHLDAASCARGIFRSRQWGTLPELLRDAGRRTDWLHIFIFSPRVYDARTGLDWLTRFNRDAEAQGLHAFLDSYLSWGVAFRAAKNWLGLNAAAWRLRGLGSAPQLEAAEWLWPILRDDWLNSLMGRTAASNCLWVELFDAALKSVPPQRMGAYLWENQGWERALLRAWRKHGHGKIIGVSHSTVPFWHLYFFDDPRTLRSRKRSAMPLPDLVAANGPAAREMMIGAGFPPENLVDVEALRYLDLARPVSRRSHDPEETKVLVLGDITPASMRSLLTMLADCVKRLPPGWRFTIKPHPVCPVRLSDYPGLERVEQTNLALDRILGDFDLAVAANGTSAAVDAYQAGLPVVVGLDGIDLNMSPLRGRADARFAGNGEEMAAALRAAARTPERRGSGSEFFFLDPELPRWRRLLS